MTLTDGSQRVDRSERGRTLTERTRIKESRSQCSGFSMSSEYSNSFDSEPNESQSGRLSAAL